MTADEIELMPYGFIKKYGTFVRKIKEQQEVAHLDSNRDFNGRWQEVRGLSALSTKEEQDKHAAFIKDRLENPANTYDEYEKTDYMSREPRLNLRAENFNFEQFQQYTAMYETARSKDEEESANFYKLVKYVLAKTENGTKIDYRNLVVRDFLKKYHLDLIDIPEEFKDLEVEDDWKPKTKSKKNVKKILSRSDKSLKGYDAWKSSDRTLIQVTGKD